MPDNDIVVVGLGMATAVGLSAMETAASVRAATMRFTESTWQDHAFQPFVIAEVPEDGLPDLAEDLAQETSLTQREMRLLRLSAKPVLDCVKRLVPLGERPGLALALPWAETMLPLNRPLFLERLARQTGRAFDVALSRADFVDRAGGLMAVAHASNLIRAQQARFMLAGGVDSFRDSFLLGVFNAQKRIKSTNQLDGFVPGEGAGFLLLTHRNTAKLAGLSPIASVSSVAHGFEPGHLYSAEPYRGDGLAAAVSAFCAVSQLQEPIFEVYSSMNGENHWAKEWGVAYLRNHDSFQPDFHIHHPTDCYGEVGAACGPMLIGLAIVGMWQGYRRSPCLVYCSSDLGERAVMSVTTERRY
jgi:3-oxoacyl-[acyl-carrier-protein] synthase-1